MNLKVSGGNSKMGIIPSISLPAIATCIKCDCNKKCYANKLERLRPSVRNAYKHNMDLLQNDPDTFWREAEAAVMMARFFRFHVSGDIVDNTYLENMVGIAARNSHCEILCFTKKYNLVNDFVANGGVIPENLHLIFSGWKNLEMNNPNNFPEAHVLYRDGSTTARPDAHECGGNCTECATTEGGCWSLKRGEQVVFKEH